MYISTYKENQFKVKGDIGLYKENPTYDQKNGQSPRVRPTDGSDESLKLEIARIQKPMSLVRWKQRELWVENWMEGDLTEPISCEAI